MVEMPFFGDKKARTSREVDPAREAARAHTIFDSNVLLATDPEVQAHARALQERITPEFSEALKSIFSSIVMRSGIALKDSNVSALDAPALFERGAHGHMLADIYTNRIVYNVGDVQSFDNSAASEAARAASERIGTTTQESLRKQLIVIEDFVANIHEKVHLMGRVYIPEKGKDNLMAFLNALPLWSVGSQKVVMELGISRTLKNLKTGEYSRENVIAYEGLTHAITLLIFDEVRKRTGMNLPFDFYIDKDFPAHEVIPYTYSSYTFMMLAIIAHCSYNHRVPLEVMTQSFIKAYFYGDEFHKKECDQLLDETFGDGFAAELGQLRAPRNEQGIQTVDGETTPFIERWGLGDVEKDFGALFREFSDLRLFQNDVPTGSSR